MVESTWPRCFMYVKNRNIQKSVDHAVLVKVWKHIRCACRLLSETLIRPMTGNEDAPVTYVDITFPSFLPSFFLSFFLSYNKSHLTTLSNLVHFAGDPLKSYSDIFGNWNWNSLLAWHWTQTHNLPNKYDQIYIDLSKSVVFFQNSKMVDQFLHEKCVSTSFIVIIALQP